MDKQRIVIWRSVAEAELFDQKPLLSQHNEDDYWQLLLCRGGTIFDMVHVVADEEGCAQTADAYRWYPRSLFKALLLVSAVLHSSRYLRLLFPKIRTFS